MSQVYEDEEEIPTADTPDSESERTIYQSGWWAGHALLWPVFIVALVLQVGGLLVANEVGGTIGAIATTIVFAAGLAFMIVAFSSWLGYYYEAKLLKKTPEVDWSPYWWLYMLATPFLTPFVVAPIYLLQRHRHVGVPWRNLSPWR